MERQKSQPFKRLRVPDDFSLKTNPDGVLTYVNAMRANYNQERNIFQNFESVTNVDTAALAIMTATVNFHQGFSLTRTNMPLNQACKEIILDSGMHSFTDFTSNEAVEGKGIMTLKNSSFRVEVKTAQRLIRHATERAFGARKRIPSAYRGLLEGMQNTFAHADKAGQGSEKWFVHVYADPANRRAIFILLDNGVGIFKSVNLRPVKGVLRALGAVTNADILREILDRKILSSTGLTYRGRGLPSFSDSAERGTLQNVTIISNDVYANLSTDEFRILKVQFEGTLLYWEVEG